MVSFYSFVVVGKKRLCFGNTFFKAKDLIAFLRLLEEYNSSFLATLQIIYCKGV